jgi:hypothetical protein
MQANYETGAGTYKHVYFNATLQTFLMWTLTLGAVVALYESIKYLIRLLARQQVSFLLYYLQLFLCRLVPANKEDIWPKFCNTICWILT